MKIKNVEAIFPLSPVQEEMLLNASSNGSATTDCSQVVFSLRGDLDVSRFERAWQEQIDLHSILRSSFAWKRIKQPVQLINKSLNFALAEEDWRELPDFEQQSRLEEFLVSDRERGFDPSVPPLIRVTLFRTQNNLWALVLSYHSILFDAQSLPSILRNVFTAYDGMNNGAVRQLAAIRPHKDYVSWMKDQKPSESRAYWQRLFENFDTPSQISLADPQSDGPVHQERFEKYARALSSVVNLDAWARKNGLRVQTVIEAAWSILLSRYGGQRDVVFGLTLSGRPDSLRGDGALVGAFTNTIPLRVLIKADTNALSFLHQVERLHHDTQHFEYTSTSRILEWTNLDAGIPLFDTCLNFDNHIVDQCASIQSKSLALQNFRLIEKAPSPLNINVHLGSSLIVDAVYSTKKYDSEMISQMLGHLENLIAGIMDHPERELAAVEMISEEESRVLLEEWNETAVEYPRERSVAELFEEVVVSHPQTIAVEYEGEQLSYEQLNSRANQLAHYLRSNGVGPEVAVGIMLDRSLELIVGLLGILKAGGAYVPLDPQYPEKRLRFMMDDSRASLVITQSKYSHIAPASLAQPLLIDLQWPLICTLPADDVDSLACSDNLAYITYTSGSTGQPKGVSVEHRAIIRLVRGANYAQLSPQHVMLQYAPVSFDASTFDIWGALLNGGKLVVMRAGEVTLRELGRTITERGVTTVFLTSALFHQMVDEEAESLAVLKQVITGGDVISPTHIDKALAHQHEGVVVSAYGPTENTTFSTCEVMRGRRPGGRRVPLGLPISNSTAYVLNERLEPVPVGVTAELYVGGEGLARGYAGRADQTAERFVPHPYAKQPGERLYRTGDEVRRRRDGKLEFIGRTDQQVKVRGFRIELGEIERVLAEHQGVEEAAVVMKQSQTGDKRLVGYVVLSAGLEIGGDVNRELREHVRSALPEYMVPAAVMVLERMPVTANGKLDRAALPELVQDQEDKALIGPRTAEEELLLDIWKQLLGVEQISIDDDFFALGGHSLLATQVMARIRQVFKVELGLQVLFEEPTIAALSSAIQSQLRQGQVSVKPELKRAERGAVVELSYGQQRLWFSEQMGEGSTLYNVPVGLRLRGELDVCALGRTLTEIVRRHETLRTRIELIGTEPYQVIDEPVELSLPVIDHSELDQQSKAAAGERVKRQEASAGFNLSTGPVIRAKLIKQDAQDHLLLVTMHHIVSDGWSMGVLVKEVSALYDAYRRGEESPLPELPVQYADYALWQREWLQGEVLEEQLRYWEEKLAGAPVSVDLPTDRARGAVRAGGGRAGQVRVEFDEELTRSVKEESRKQALTVYMLLMGALGVLLTRYSRSPEVVIGSPIANRVMAEVEGLIGFFVNTLALRVKVDEEETVEELLKRVREEVLGAYAHQDVPYEKVVERVQVERAGEAGGLFQVDLTVQNAPRGEIRMEGLEIAAESVRNERAKLDLTIVIGEEGGRLVGGVEYNAELYEAESVRRMIRHLEELLRGVVAGAGKRVRELELMSAAERRQVLEEWNETAVEYPRERSVAELFEEVVVSHPHAIAVEYEGEQLSYEQLNSRANQLAHYLRSNGVGPEVAVGITLDRSLELIVGLVAILKAGGAYVPLDPSYPLERLAFMLEDARIGILVTTEKQLDLLPAHWAQTICLDTDAEMIASLSEENLSSEVSAENLAYVMYTSGSTGQPKGVSVEQRAIARLVRGANYVELGPEEVLLQYAPVSFDASTFEVWGALLNGGKLVVMRAGEVTLRELGRTLTEQAVTTLWLTSALFHQMVDEEVSSLAGVQQLIAGGDVLSVGHVNKVLQQQRQGAVINGYGPTENTTFSTCEVMRGKGIEGDRGVPIGLPISNSTAYVLNERMEPVPVGVRAELYVGGEGLARGYAGRADQTAERFVPHPYAKQPGERLYRTGDEVRRRRDGKLEFIGRTDQQVKVRGFRIELAEIERVLAQHAAVEEAAVVMRQSQTGDKRLVGYVVLSAGLEIGGDVNRELREHVRSALPEYMVPAAVMVLERMPVTANGKLDRAALPELDQGQLGAAEYENPRTPVEEVLAGIWAELLELESVRINADFFDLGGHSLLVMRLNAWIRDAFGVEVTVGELFESPTLSAMAAIVEQRLRSGQRLQMPPLERVVDHQTAPLSYAQQRLWFLQNLHPEDTSYNMPFGLKLKGKLDTGALSRAFSEIVRRHETLRTRFLAEDGGAIQVVQPARDWQLPLIDLTGLGESQQQAETTALTRREAGKRFDLARDESLHTVLLRRSPEDHLLLVTMHHIVSDGWSMGVLIREISALYEAYRRREESPLAELPVQYADYARWQREWLQGEVLDEQLKYWEEKLAGAPVQVELPTDHARAAFRAGRAGQVRVEFDEELTRSVKQESRKQALTVYMLLMGAVGVLLTRYSRSPEVVIGSPIANRGVTEVEGLIGFFVNTLALRVRVDEEETVEELLKRVREEVLGAYAHRDVPYEKVVERVQVERAGEAGGLFQVVLAVQNAPRGEIRMEGLELAAESVGNERAKFEMTIGLGENGGRLVGGVEYNAELYEAESVQRMMRHLEELLRGVVAGEGKRVRELEMMSAAERRQVLEEWNETAVEYPRERSVAELFEEVAVNHAQAIAVEYEGEQLSYEQLNSRANQLAHYLRSRGVGPEVAVGIMLDRSLELIVGLVAILKASGAYVPLDPQYPEPRLTFMLADSKATTVITHSKYAQVIPDNTTQLVVIDQLSEEIAAQSEQDLAPSASGSNLAYIIYTSGSTGQPKGVSVEQRAVTRLVRGANYVALGPEEVLLQYAPVSFDASTFEVWGALLNGGKLVVMRAGEVTLRDLACTLTEQAVTTLWLTSALFHQMVDEEVSSLAEVRQLIAGGDVLSVGHVNKVLQQQRQGAVINGYGPTENTTFSTCEVMRGKGVEGDRGVPIGLPISNSTAYVLNERMEPVPVGVRAELYVGGEGLARGYAGRADQTAERFVPHPYAKQPGERLYRTGDEVRRRRDGKLEFIGRTDQQVKVRGFRIELAEIERVLAEHEGVEEAAVVMKQSQTSDKRLVGYVVLSAGLEIGGEVNRELREHVRSALPEYMVPAAVMVLERMPVTANGKLDRAALPELDQGQLGAAEQENPRTPVEEVLAGIWAELLELESVSIHDDFFALGGHSLLAMRLNAWIREAFGVEVTVGELFASPTLTAMAAIVEQRLRSGQRLQIPSLERVDHQTAPLSYAQQRLWFLQNLHPEDTSYNMPFGLKLKGQLDIGALSKAFSEIVRRHETLRTRFIAEDGGAIQVVQPARDWQLPLIDLSGLEESQQQAEIKAVTRSEAGKKFDLARDESLSTVLLRRSPEDHLLLVTMHHIVSDGWSMGVLVKEVSVLYDTYRRGEESPLPELPVQYADYALWQREWLQGEVLEEQLKYWEEKLAGAPASVDLPTDHARGALRRGRAGQVRVEFDEELTRSVKQESRKQALTVYMLLMGAVGVLLTRYSRSQEVVIGSPTANRVMAEVEGLIGFFVNTLALRVRVDEEETVEELLKRVREEVLEAYAHQDVPYEKVVERIKVERAGGAGELFQVMVVVQNAPRDEIRMEGLELAAESVGNERAKFELTIGLGENGGRLVGGVEYNAELYEAESVQRMMRHLEELLRGVVAGGGKRVRELEMMSAVERRQVLEEWNETVVEYPRERSVAELFEEIVVSHPQAIAVEYEGEQLSYEQLNSRANQLAHYLRSRGVGPEVAVGIMLDRSLELIVGLVAILKAGGAYVPLDPQYPQQRLTFMLADSKATTVITHSKYAQVIPDNTTQLVVIDQLSEEIAAQSEQDLAPSASGSNLAYIIYTSGSTGQPKGVSVEQRAVTRLVRGANYVALGPAEVLLQYAPVSFDASTFEVWGALLNGGKLVVMRAGEVTLRELGRTLTEQAVTTLWLTSALFHQMVDEEVSSLAEVRQLIAGGDVLSVGHVNKVLQQQRQGAVINGYGPTENTTFSTCEVMRGQSVEGRGVPIGLPISNSTAYVLNERMEPVPVGVRAELYVGGEGLARGYAGRADQTAERFVPHPYAKQPGERLYRTGDEVRRRRDGKLEFIGRSDQQVKVRGFRIELAEIERVLAEHAAVEEAAVVMRQSQTGDKRLVGYVVLSAGVEIGGDVNRELREHVRSALPEYMVPAAVMVLERMPVTANGKLDRAALPELVQDQEDKALAGPRTAEEELLLDMWKQLLGVEQISIHDDFFDLGGHSLLATQVMARIRQVFKVELGLQVLFEEPTIAGLSGAIQSQLRQGRVAVKPELKRAERGAVVELSYAQQRLWFSEQMGEGSTFYNVPVGLRLRGELDVCALGRTLQEIVRRHEALRTRIELIGTQPYQVIDEPVELSLPVIDHSELDQQSKTAAGERVKRQEASAGFNLSTGPVMRAKLIKQDAQDHLLLVTMHHIVSDGWSMGVLVKEVSALYEAYHRGEESPLPELPVQYADYALWQREWLQGEVMEEQLKYWEEKLAGAPAMVDLPTDRPRAAFKAGGGKAGQVRVEFDEELTRSVKQESRKQALTVYMLLMGAVGVLLTRYSRSQEVVIGGPIANRVMAEVEGLIGFFVNTLALRVRVDEEETVEELLKRVREDVLGAYAHQDVPYEKVVERVQVERAGEGGLFQVTVTMQNTPRDEIRMEGLEIEAESVGNERAKFEMTIGLGEEGGRLVGGVEYNAELYEAESVQRMMRHLEELLRGVVAGAGKRVRELELMSAAERRQVLEEWNATTREIDIDRSVQDQIAAMAATYPEQIAVEAGDHQLSYKQLNARANQLAHYLSSKGVGPEVAVGVMLDRSIELVVALVAILKASGAYLPLDPDYPEQRLRFMLDDSQARLVITDSSYRSLVDDSAAELIVMDQESEQINAPSEQEVVSRVSGDNLAYIIYTSGSTGVPKGVMIPHRSLYNHMLWMLEEFAFSLADRVLQKTPYSFDASVWELFAPLMSGARLVLARAGGHQDVEYLIEEIKVREITVLQVVPSLLKALLDVGLEECQSLQRVFSGGEVLTSEVKEEFARQLGVELINLYGPTEATIEVTYWRCEGEQRKRSEPIGRPISNARVYVLGERMAAVGIGMRGELYIGGESVGRGYIGRPDLTAERFVPDPYSVSGGERLYRTADEVRYRGDGVLEYEGRRDGQVKVRGYRIELGEIEATLSRHPGIAECVIVLKEKRQGDRQIAAYFVPKVGQVLNLSELRSFLKVRLPGYMIPAAFVSMEAMPFTPNGKIDRSSLPEPVVWTESAGLDGGAPRSPIEEMLVQVWKEVLEVENIRINDNFFDMGGHSLLATLLTTRLRQLFELEFPLQSIFAAPTIAEMAAVIEKMMSGGPSQQAPPIVRVPRDTMLPLTFAQERLWFINQLEPGNPFYNIPVAVALSGPLDVAVLWRSIREIVARHEALRTTFISFDGEPVQVISPSIDLPFPVVDISALDESHRAPEIQRLVNEEALVPFDLSRGPLIRVSLIRVAAEEQVFLLTMHHIISDAWSMRVFIQELKQLYSTFSAGQPSSLPELSVQYADFAHWQRRYVQGSVLEGHLDFWRRHLAGAPTLIDLPLDRERPPFQTYHGAKQSFALSKELSESIKKLCREEDVTLFMALLATYNVLLYSYRPQDDIVVGTDMAIRNRPEIEPLIGFFINLIPVRTEFRGNPSYRQLLAKVREATLGANLHQEVPFHKLIEELQPERDPSYAPLVQVLFVLENVPIQVMEISGVSLKPLEVESKASKFDLVMIQKEIGQNIIGTLMYNTDLFDASTIKEMIDRYEKLLSLITEQPAIQVSDLQVQTPGDEKTADLAAGFEEFMRAQPTMVSLSEESLINTSYIAPDSTLPFVITPAVSGLDLAEWAESNHDYIDQELLKHGGILFRGFEIDDVRKFERVAQAICSELFNEYGDLPRDSVGGKVYTSTPYPAGQPIHMHNESSQMHQWPLKICFHCVTPAEEGGETPIVDCRKIYQALPPELRARFAEKKLMYVRNFTPGIDVSWQQFFRTEDKNEVEQYCRQAGIEVEWKGDDELQTRTVCPAIAVHPKTNEMVFFNQIQAHHVSCLDPAVRESLQTIFADEDMPRNVRFGDGSQIDDEIVDHIRSLYEEASISFAWQKGDILLLDNMLTAHGRNPFTGQRKIVVAMGEMISDEQKQPQGLSLAANLQGQAGD